MNNNFLDNWIEYINQNHVYCEECKYKADHDCISGHPQHCFIYYEDLVKIREFKNEMPKL